MLAIPDYDKWLVNSEMAFEGADVTDRPYEIDFNNDVLYFDEGEIFEYNGAYFDPEDAYGFIKRELVADQFPHKYYGKKTIDYAGRETMITEDVFEYNDQVFNSDESLEFLVSLGAEKAVA